MVLSIVDVSAWFGRGMILDCVRSPCPFRRRVAQPMKARTRDIAAGRCDIVFGGPVIGGDVNPERAWERHAARLLFIGRKSGLSRIYSGRLAL
ncbi:hypothetical protein EMIT0111MI5_350001 [Burkholderia sp. IT-111MI5]